MEGRTTLIQVALPRIHTGNKQHAKIGKFEEHLIKGLFTRVWAGWREPKRDKAVPKAGATK